MTQKAEVFVGRDTRYGARVVFSTTSLTLLLSVFHLITSAIVVLGVDRFVMLKFQLTAIDSLA